MERSADGFSHDFHTKGVKMEHKKKYGFSGFALLTIAIISLVGVGFAVAYQGSAVNTDNEMSGEAITVELSSYSSFLAGQYSVNSSNNGTNVTLSDLQKDGAATSLASIFFKYEGGEFSVADSDQGYAAVEAGTITVSLKQTDGAVANDVDLTIVGAQDAVANQYGISFVYVYDGEVFDPADGIQNVTLTSGAASLVLKAYVIYSKSVPTTSIGEIKGFALEDADITFTATASSA